MFKLLKKTNTKERIALVFSVTFIVIQVWLELKIPDYLSEITTKLQIVETTR